MNYIVKVQQTRTWAVQVTADNDWDAEQKALYLFVEVDEDGEEVDHSDIIDLLDEHIMPAGAQIDTAER